MPKLKLVLCEGRNIQNNNCHVVFQSAKNKTKSKKQTKNKDSVFVWNQTFQLDLPENLNEELIITVFDPHLLTNTRLGQVKISTKELTSNREHEMRVQLLNPKGKPSGELLLKLTALDFGQEFAPKRPIFGVPLAELVKRDGKPIPIILEKIFQYLSSEKVIKEEGLLRLAGSAVEVTKLANKFEEGEEIDLTQCDPHTVSNLLKKYLRDLPDKLIPDVYTNQIKMAFERFEGQKELIAQVFKKIFSLLDEPNFALFRALIEFLALILKHENENKMSITNITICLAPTLKMFPGTLSYPIEHFDAVFKEPFVEDKADDIIQTQYEPEEEVYEEEYYEENEGEFVPEQEQEQELEPEQEQEAEAEEYYDNDEYYEEEQEEEQLEPVDPLPAAPSDPPGPGPTHLPFKTTPPPPLPPKSRPPPPTPPPRT